LLNIVGVLVGIWRYFYGPQNEILTVFVSMAWVFYNLIIPGGAVAVSVEQAGSSRASRGNQHACGDRPQDGHLFSCTVHDFSTVVWDQNRSP
jgi:cellulose synthase (UDP-forming)